tara:strand:+ start:6146 stop:7357 length:1212 start_codon:yes stop_codon:yes gene_type:complete
MALRLRRGTDAERLLITPLQGELIYATDTKKIYVGDGAAVGGLLVGPFAATAFDLVNDTTPQLGGDLVLNGNNITGIGNIMIDGTITATGNIGLGDADVDEITVLGVINSALRPALDLSYDLGTEARRWQHLYVGGITIDQALTTESITVTNNINGSDSSIIYNATTDTLTATTFVGNVTGSVFSDNSAVLVDGITGNMYATALTTDRIDGTLGYIDLQGVDAINNLVLRYYEPVPGNHTEVYGVTDGSTGTGINTYVNRGTLNSPEIIQQGDIVHGSNIVCFTGTTYQLSSSIVHLIDPAATVDGSTIPGMIAIATFTDGNPANVKGITVDSRGYVNVNNGLTQAAATLDINGFAKLAVLTAAPSPLTNGLIAIADGTSWNPTSSGVQTVVAYINSGWVALS